MRILLALLFLLSSPLVSHAQFDSSFLTEQTITLEKSPEYPNPGDIVSVTLNDYQSAASYGSEISWYIDNVLVPEAHNQRSLEMTAGEAGSQNAIKAVLSRPSGGSEVVSTTIRPHYLDIIIEPQTHVPTFYRGRALPSIGSVVNLTALVNNGKMLGTDLIYTWNVNDAVIDGGALRGRNKVSFITPAGSEVVISLQVSTLDGTVLAKRTLAIPSVSPQMHFYEENTLYGTSLTTIKKDFYLIGNSATIKAEPYYLDSQVFNRPDVLDWTINNARVEPSGKNPYEVVLQRTGYPGIANLGVHVRSTTQFLQGARGNIDIHI